MTELYDLRKKIERYLILFLGVTALLYGAYNAYPLMMGPTIEIFAPGDGDMVASTTFQVIGKAKRAKVVTLQGKEITTDPEGSFMETLVALRPYTILVVTATDGYGKTITKMIRVTPE